MKIEIFEWSPSTRCTRFKLFSIAQLREYCWVRCYIYPYKSYECKEFFNDWGQICIEAWIFYRGIRLTHIHGNKVSKYKTGIRQNVLDKITSDKRVTT